MKAIWAAFAKANVISSKIKPDSVVYTDLYGSYNSLNVSLFHHHRINHSADFAKDENHLNGIDIRDQQYSEVPTGIRNTIRIENWAQCFPKSNLIIKAKF